jgi:cysteine desulfurase / selenocysteine lyase
MTLNPEEYRKHFPTTGRWNYLNHATYGPFSVETTRAIAKLASAWEVPPELDHDENGRTVDAVREMIASIVNGSPQNFAFTGSLADSMSLAASGIDWRPGDNCVIPVDEFPSLVYPFLNLERRGVEVRFVDKDDYGFTSIDKIREATDNSTRAIVLSHVEFMTGFRNDLPSLTQLARDIDALLICDVTQSLGPCEIDVESTGIDVFGAHSYKWLMASYGVGVTYLSDRAIERIHPTYAGRLSVKAGWEDLDYSLNFRESAARYQTGGLNWITLSGLKASLELISSVTPQEIAAHTIELTERLLNGVDERGFTVVSNRSLEHRSAVVTFTTGDRDGDAGIIADLRRQKISVELRGKGIRVSPYFYNNADEIDALLDALPARTD